VVGSVCGEMSSLVLRTCSEQQNSKHGDFLEKNKIKRERERDVGKQK
jgi:hypothetical protein